MDLRLEILCVALTGSFTSAGRQLHLSVSRQILLLEEELKEQPFPRIRRKIAARRAGAQARAICCELAP